MVWGEGGHYHSTCRLAFARATTGTITSQLGNCGIRIRRGVRRECGLMGCVDLDGHDHERGSSQGMDLGKSPIML